MILKTAPIRSEKHRRFIASLPCCASGVYGKTQAAHIRYLTGGGLGLKPSDEWCVPLSVEEHARQHAIGEEKFWPNIEAAKTLARNLYLVSGNETEGARLVREFRFKNFGDI